MFVYGDMSVWSWKQKEVVSFLYLKFKYAITGIQFNNKENYQKLTHDVGKKQK